mgnify:FL=1
MQPLVIIIIIWAVELARLWASQRKALGVRTLACLIESRAQLVEGVVVAFRVALRADA